MSWVFGTWLLAGVALGAFHAMGIRQSTREAGPFVAILGVVRLLAVGLGLVAAAILGGIIPIAIGWGLGFASAVAIMIRLHPSLMNKEVSS